MAYFMKREFEESINYKALLKRDLANFSLQKNSYVQGSICTTHAHENARFVFVLRGKFSETYEGNNRHCSPFMAIFRPPQEEHSENYYGKGIVCLSIDIKPNWLEHIRPFNVNLNGSADFRSNKLISLITRLNDEFDNWDHISALAIEALLLEIAVEIYRQKKNVPSKDKKPLWLNDVKDLIHSRLTSILTISEIASLVEIHPAHLSRAFRQNCGCTIAEYIRRKRIDFACTKLMSSNESLAEIALNSGFSDQSHFSKTFKKVMNLTPAEYRAAVSSR
jgi:AraC family transcriptional regulator